MKHSQILEAKRPAPVTAASLHPSGHAFASRADSLFLPEPVGARTGAARSASPRPGHDFSRLQIYAQSRPAPPEALSHGRRLDNRPAISFGQVADDQVVAVPIAGPIRSPSPPRQQREKSEASWDDPGPHDDKAKVEVQTSTIAGLAIGGLAGAAVGGILGGPLGALGGLALGAGLGALIGHVIGAGGINWDAAGYAAVAAGGSSTTVEKPFAVGYKASANTSKNVWELEVASIKGGANIEVRTGGSRDPIANPPISDAEAKDAVNVMKGYYARGRRGTWHTEAASKNHEEHHVREWRGSADHYWPVARQAIHSLTAPLATHATEHAAIAAMRAGPTGADALVQKFHTVSRRYWFTLSDGPSSRPYAAGQRVLNEAVGNVQALASSKGWVVAQGRDFPSAEPPCYQPWLPFAP